MDGIEHRVMINGIAVDAFYGREAVRNIFLPLLKRLTELQREKGRRILAMMAAPPGAGKSTLASFLEQLSHDRGDLAVIQAIGMDGFHRRQEYLVSHCAVRDGRSIPMVKIKGAPVTFDLEHLTERVRRAAAGEACGWPAYDRLLHNPREDALTVRGEVILIEGNYLLLDEPGWRGLKEYADYTISLSAGEAFLRERLIDRRTRTGVSREEAARFVDFSDMPNVRLCLQKTFPADLQIRIDGEGDYHIAKKGSRARNEQGNAAAGSSGPAARDGHQPKGENRMELIPSFSVDHTRIVPGIFTSRVDTMGDRTATTYDVRITRPNREPAVDPAAMHTMEHLIATYLRNDPEWKDQIIYWGPMGCMTGCYLIMKGNRKPREIYRLILNAFRSVEDAEEVPGASPENCGNYLMHNLGMAKWYAGRFADYLAENADNPKIFEYPGTERAVSADGRRFFDS